MGTFLTCLQQKKMDHGNSVGGGSDQECFPRDGLAEMKEGRFQAGAAAPAWVTLHRTPEGKRCEKGCFFCAEQQFCPLSK